MSVRIPKTWVEISESALRNNASVLQRTVGGTVMLMGVVKSNAYGHDTDIVVKALADHVDWFGVDSLVEAEHVRAQDKKTPILILGYTPKDDLAQVVKEGFSQVCYSRETAKEMGEHASASRPAKIHLKVETGTSRQGLHLYDLPAFVKHVQSLSHVEIEGVATHYANIEDADVPDYAMKQLAHFEEAVRLLSSLNAAPNVIHTACSAAALLYPQTHFSMVRAGIALYGLWPSEGTKATAVENGVPTTLIPALTWKTRVAQVKDITMGTPVSYGLTETVKRDSRIAVIPVGYWDGFDRGLSSKGEVLIGGKRAKVLGRVCMNITVVDVTDIPEVREDDEVVLIGAQGDDEVSAEAMATTLNTINYEVVTRINPRLPRITVE